MKDIPERRSRIHCLIGINHFSSFSTVLVGLEKALELTKSKFSYSGNKEEIFQHNYSLDVIS